MIGTAKALDRLDLNSDTESMIDAIFGRPSRLSPEDQNRPQVVKTLPMVKEESGFTTRSAAGAQGGDRDSVPGGLIKVLIATETMSRGQHASRSVVFTRYGSTTVGWHQGYLPRVRSDVRTRGRRGLDDRGLVVLMMDERMDPQIAKGMLHESDPLNPRLGCTIQCC